ncbi:GGDEF domain-containing protein [Motilimonas sp. KMU-193]|uniref:GGDEF domain-containing protein n=1 Tax=Motilimonas sp. KMU-193 TaxID=3388668 RepID=UPI00396B2B49
MKTGYKQLPIRYGAIGLLACALAAAIVIALWVYGLPSRHLVITPENALAYSAVSDASNSGLTKASAEVVDDRWQLDCSISLKYQWPFCALSLALAQDWADGVDLSSYSGVRLKLAYIGKGSTRLRFFMRNYDPAYSIKGDHNSLKANVVELDVRATLESVYIPMSSVYVASWWLSNQKIPLKDAMLDVSNVPYIELSTADLPESGQVRLIVESIEFVGASPLSSLPWLVGICVLSLLGFMLLLLVSRWLVAEHQRQVLFKRNQELLKDNRRFAKLAEHDPLTGVRNRIGIEALLLQQQQVFEQTGKPLSVIFADIDYFKSINDKFGHQVGDQVLCLFAQRLKDKVRSSDILVRWGGEEFLILCLGTGGYGARYLAEELRKTVTASPWPQGVQVTASFGVATLGNESIVNLVSRADEALYDAKHQGRNCVVTKSP